MRKQISRTTNQDEIDGKRPHFGSLLAARLGLTDAFEHRAEPFLARYTQQRTPWGEGPYFKCGPLSGAMILENRGEHNGWI